MPTIKLDRLRVGNKYDRRVKIPPIEHEKIKRLKKAGESYRSIARRYGVNHRLIIFIVNPHIYAHSKELYKERRKDLRYYDREKNRLAIKSLRDYKKELIKKGKLKLK